jgi:hypothetical protein
LVGELNGAFPGASKCESIADASGPSHGYFGGAAKPHWYQFLWSRSDPGSFYAVMGSVNVDYFFGPKAA